MPFSDLLDRFSGIRALVIGDVMLDEYIMGSVERISPEAPVMVVKKTSGRAVPGGAANVAKNIAALGGSAVVGGVVGEDPAGEELRQRIDATNGLSNALITDPARSTTRKTRVVANHSHQVLRIDEESEEDIAESIGDEALKRWKQELSNCQILVLSDYTKGLLTPFVVAQLITAARDRQVPVLANAKPISAARYRGADLVSLNRSEASQLLGTAPKSRDEAGRCAARLCDQLDCDGVLITLGDQGMAACWRGGQFSVPAIAVEAYDVAGAGDTVLATIALGMSVAPLSEQVLDLAAHASAKVVQHVGVAVPSPQDLADLRSLG